MTTIIPPLSGSNLVTWLNGMRPYTDIQPFTYRDGITFMEQIETLREYVENTLVPYVSQGFTDINVGDIIEAMLTAVATNDVVLTDAEIAAVLNQAASQTVIRIQQMIDAKTGSLWAPAPKGNGQDDTPVIQPLFDAAQTVNGTLNFRNGTYLLNLAGAQSFSQPKLVGVNMDKTILKAYDNTKPVVRMKGGSGKLSGGYLSDLTINASDAGGGIGLQLADTNGVRWSRIRFDGTLDYGIEFLNEAPLGFTEYNRGDADFRSSVRTAVHYKRAVAATAESFHGSGIESGTVINQATGASTPPIVIEAGCFPYGAPLKAAVFPRNSNVPIIRNLNSGRMASFFAELDIEVQGNAANVEVADSVTGFGIGLFGEVIALVSGGPLRMGAARLYDKYMFQAAANVGQSKQWHENTVFTANPTNLTRDRTGNAFVFVEINAPNYNYQAFLHVWRSSFNPGGGVTVVSEGNYINNVGYGKPTFAVSNYMVTVTNPAFPIDGSVKMYVSITPTNMSRTDDRFVQY